MYSHAEVNVVRAAAAELETRRSSYGENTTPVEGGVEMGNAAGRAPRPPSHQSQVRHDTRKSAPTTIDRGRCVWILDDLETFILFVWERRGVLLCGTNTCVTSHHALSQAATHSNQAGASMRIVRVGEGVGGPHAPHATAVGATADAPQGQDAPGACATTNAHAHEVKVAFENGTKAPRSTNAYSGGGAYATHRPSSGKAATSSSSSARRHVHVHASGASTERAASAKLGGASTSELTSQLPGYTIGKTIGEGGFCSVRAGVHRLTGSSVAVKVYDKRRLSDPADRRRVGREIRVLKRLASPRVVQLLEVVDAPSRMFMVMEHATGGSLLDFVRQRKRLDEPTARRFICQAAAGIEYCHAHGVIHRDIKLENLLLDEHDDLRLIDFGLAAILPPGGENKRLKVHCGSPSYAAPEIVGRTLYEGQPVDVWSLGVVLFACLAGYLPFHAGNNKQELCQKIMRGAFSTPDWVSREGADLLRRMLTVDPARRINIKGMWQHPWMRGAGGGVGISSSIAAAALANGRPMTAAVGAKSSASDARAFGYGGGWAGASGASYTSGISGSAVRDEVPSHAEAVAAQSLDDDIVRALQDVGYEPGAIAEAMAAGEHNYLTASYWLMKRHKQREAERGVASASRDVRRDGGGVKGAAPATPVGAAYRPASAPNHAASAAAAASDAAAAAATNGHRRPVAHDTHRVGVVPQHTRAARAAW